MNDIELSLVVEKLLDKDFKLVDSYVKESEIIPLEMIKDSELPWINISLYFTKIIQDLKCRIVVNSKSGDTKFEIIKNGASYSILLKGFDEFKFALSKLDDILNIVATNDINSDEEFGDLMTNKIFNEYGIDEYGIISS